ncbi:MAG: GNAT family N-acetyltransferase [Candidatus Acidiferrales bacterium]
MRICRWHWDYWGDPGVTALIGGPFTPEMVRARLANEIAQMQEYGLQHWPVFLLDGNEHIGCAGLRPYRGEDRVHELGVHLRPGFWSRGLANEAARTTIDYGFDTLGAEALFAGHHPYNDAFRQLLMKLGFEEAIAERDTVRDEAPNTTACVSTSFRTRMATSCTW